MQPKQLYKVTLVLRNLQGTHSGVFDRELLFMNKPKASDIISGVEQANAFYADHFHVNDALLELAKALRSDDTIIHSASGWCRHFNDLEASASCTSVDFFDNNKENSQ